MTLSPVSTRMRFLRILPAVWAMISWSFESFTRNVALGSNSLTVPSNSSSSSFAIRPLAALEGGEYHRNRPKAREMGSVRRPVHRKAAPDARHQFIAGGAVGVQPLVAGAFGERRVGGRPVFDDRGRRARQLHRLVVGFGREGDHEVEGVLLHVLERLGPVLADLYPDLL